MSGEKLLMLNEVKHLINLRTSFMGFFGLCPQNDAEPPRCPLLSHLREKAPPWEEPSRCPPQKQRGFENPSVTRVARDISPKRGDENKVMVRHARSARLTMTESERHPLSRSLRSRQLPLKGEPRETTLSLALLVTSPLRGATREYTSTVCTEKRRGKPPTGSGAGFSLRCFSEGRRRRSCRQCG